MKRKICISAVVLLILAGLFIGCASGAKGGGKGPFIELSNLDPKLEPFETKAETNDKGEIIYVPTEYNAIYQQMPYYVSGKTKYDTLFKESARIEAILTQVNFAIDRFQESPDRIIGGMKVIFGEVLGLTRAVSGDAKELVAAAEKLMSSLKTITEAGDEVKTEAAFVIVMTGYGFKAVPDLVDSVQDMIKSAQALNPKADFTGTDALKAPQVAGALTDAIGSLKNSAEELKTLAEKLQSLLEQLIEKLTG
jgi:hypothetical protein